MFNQNQPTPENTEFLTVQETAELLRTTPKSIYNYLCRTGVKEGNKRKQFPNEIYVKLGRKVLFIKPKLISWVLAGGLMKVIGQDERGK